MNELIGKVRSPKILCQYGKVLSAERRFERALEVLFILFRLIHCCKNLSLTYLKICLLDLREGKGL